VLARDAASREYSWTGGWRRWGRRGNVFEGSVREEAVTGRPRTRFFGAGQLRVCRFCWCVVVGSDWSVIWFGGSDMCLAGWYGSPWQLFTVRAVKRLERGREVVHTFFDGGGRKLRHGLV